MLAIQEACRGEQGHCLTAQILSEMTTLLQTNRYSAMQELLRWLTWW